MNTPIITFTVDAQASQTYLTAQSADAQFDLELMFKVVELPYIYAIAYEENARVDGHHLRVALMPYAEPHEVALQMGLIIAKHHDWKVYDDVLPQATASSVS